MNVKKYLVENSEYFMNELERQLCIQGISYVRIENEFHFNNQIIRFFDFNDFRETMIKEKMKEEIDFFKPLTLVSQNNEPIFVTFFVLKFFKPLIVVEENYEKRTPYYEPRNKKMNRQESHLVKQKLKTKR